MGMFDLTGRADAETIKKRYQREVDNAYENVTNKVRWLYGMNHKLKSAMSDIERLERDIKAGQDGRKELYESLQNLLVKETNFEKEMWSTTQRGSRVTTINVKQRFTDSDVDEIRYDSMLNYLQKYPEYASKSSFSKILDKIVSIEAGIKNTKQSFHGAIARAKMEISYFPRNIMEAKNTIKTYNRILKEGVEKLESMRYKRSIFFRLSSESNKLKVMLDVLPHKVNENADTINRIEEEVSLAGNRFSYNEDSKI
jgi:hypothetical protein